jgi:hypothetical protein
MKLTSTLRLRDSLNKTTTTIAEDCTVSQAFSMITSWCTDNNANDPKPSDIWKTDSNLVIRITTKDNKYINIFTISE